MGRTVLLLISALGILLAAGGCGSSAPAAPSPASPSSNTTLMFTVAPMDVSVIESIVPLGNLNPPGHTLPTSHMYVNNRALGAGPAPAAPVVAPADGRLQFVRWSGAEAQIGIEVTSQFTYYFAHVLLDPRFAPGVTVHAGDRLGTTTGSGYGIDFGLINSGRTLWFANPARYPVDLLNGDAPLKYFAEPVRSALYAKVRSLGNPDGKFDFDVDGHLAGNWFLEGLSPADSSSSLGWSGQLAFAYDNYNPASARISIGGTLSVTGVFGVPDGRPDPRAVSPESGIVAYPLLRTAEPGTPPGAQVGLLLVRMLDGQRIMVETIADASASAGDFSTSARVYVR
jgi:hypothetical protein